MSLLLFALVSCSGLECEWMMVLVRVCEESRMFALFAVVWEDPCDRRIRALRKKREREREHLVFWRPFACIAVSNASSCHFHVLPSVSLSNNIPVSHFQISS